MIYWLYLYIHPDNGFIRNKKNQQQICIGTIFCSTLKYTRSKKIKSSNRQIFNIPKPKILLLQIWQEFQHVFVWTWNRLPSAKTLNFSSKFVVLGIYFVIFWWIKDKIPEDLYFCHINKDTISPITPIFTFPLKMVFCRTFFCYFMKKIFFLDSDERQI